VFSMCLLVISIWPVYLDHLGPVLCVVLLHVVHYLAILTLLLRRALCTAAISQVVREASLNFSPGGIAGAFLALACPTDISSQTSELEIDKLLIIQSSTDAAVAAEAAAERFPTIACDGSGIQ